MILQLRWCSPHSFRPAAPAIAPHACARCRIVARGILDSYRQQQTTKAPSPEASVSISSSEEVHWKPPLPAMGGRPVLCRLQDFLQCALHPVHHMTTYVHAPNALTCLRIPSVPELPHCHCLDYGSELPHLNYPPPVLLHCMPNGASILLLLPLLLLLDS